MDTLRHHDVLKHSYVGFSQFVALSNKKRLYLSQSDSCIETQANVFI